MNSRFLVPLCRAVLIAVTMSAVVVMSSCRDQGDSFNHRVMYTQLVTVADTGAGGSDMKFTFRRFDDSPLITLTAPAMGLNEKALGQRALLYYYSPVGDPYAPGPVEVRGLSVVNTDTVKARHLERYNWDASPIWLNAIWRTGEYLNMRVRLDYSDKPRYLGLLLDSASMESSVPQLYLLHDLDGAPDNFLREAYLSFYIADLWNRPDLQGIDVHVNDINFKKDVYSFTKASTDN